MKNTSIVSKVESTQDRGKSIHYILTTVSIGKIGYRIMESIKHPGVMNVQYLVNGKLNASSRAWRGMGRTFYRWSDLHDAYKKLQPVFEEMKATHELAILSHEMGNKVNPLDN